MGFYNDIKNIQIDNLINSNMSENSSNDFKITANDLSRSIQNNESLLLFDL